MGVVAQTFADDRKKDKPKYRRMTSQMKACIKEKMVNEQWSPEQIKGRCDLKNIPMVSVERIYQYVYQQQSVGIDLYKHLRTARRKRKKRMHQKHQRGSIPNRIMIDQRPTIVESKERFGGWEVDTMISANHQSAILVLTERKSQYELIAKVDATKSESIKKEMINILAPFKSLVKTITSDNGVEFAKHEIIRQKLQADFYFAHSYSPWQMGLNEYQNKLIRQYLPKKTNFNTISHETIHQITNKLNSRPRKSLGFKSPNQVFLSNFINPVALMG